MLTIHQMVLDLILTHRGARPQFISLDAARALQDRYPCRDGYKYDDASKKARAAERLELISKAADLSRPLKILEVGGGDGQLSLLLSHRGHDCTLLDFEDWRDDEVKHSTVDFIGADASARFSMESCSFDLCVSFNTMEHIHDPANAYHEMLRVLRPGGTLYLQFAPLFNSAWGLHAYRVVHFPYPQFLLSPDDFKIFVEDRVNYDLGRTRADFQYVNRWSAAAFHELFMSEHESASCAVTIHRELEHLPLIYQYRRAFAGRGLSVLELVSSGIDVVAQKHRDN